MRQRQFSLVDRCNELFRLVHRKKGIEECLQQQQPFSCLPTTFARGRNVVFLFRLNCVTHNKNKNPIVSQLKIVFRRKNLVEIEEKKRISVTFSAVKNEEQYFELSLVD